MYTIVVDDADLGWNGIISLGYQSEFATSVQFLPMFILCVDLAMMTIQIRSEYWQLTSKMQKVQPCVYRAMQ